MIQFYFLFTSLSTLHLKFDIGIAREETFDMTTSNGYHDSHPTSTQYVFHEAISTRSSLPGVEDSESEFSCSQPGNESFMTSPNINNDAIEKYHSNDVTNKKVINHNLLGTIVNKRAFRTSSAIELNNLQDCFLVSFETREGKAKHNKHFIPSTGTLVRQIFNVEITIF